MLEKEMGRIRRGLAQKIKMERKKAGLTQKGLAMRMGVSQPFISKLESGDSLPEKKTLIKLARALDKEDDYFLATLTLKESGDLDKREIMEKLARIEKMVTQKYVDNRPIPLDLFDREDKARVKEIEFPVGAGECFTNDNVVGEHLLPASLTHGAEYMIRVRGKSMEPFIMDGEIILVVPQNFIERDGQLAVVNISNQVNAVKFVFVKNGMIGLGRTREDASWYPRDEIRIQGIVVSKISSYNVIREMENKASGK